MHTFANTPAPENQYQPYTKEWIFSKYTGLSSGHKANNLPPVNKGLSMDDLSTTRVGWTGKLGNLPTPIATMAHEDLYWRPYGIDVYYTQVPIIASLLTDIRSTVGHDTTVRILANVRRQLEYFCVPSKLDPNVTLAVVLAIAKRTIGEQRLQKNLHAIVVAAAMTEISRLPGYQMFGQHLITTLV